MTTATEVVEGLPIVCRLLAPELRAREQVVQREVSGAVEEVRELPDGYALRFPSEADRLTTLAEFIRFERACCPFLRLELHAEQQDGPLWLRLRGPEGTKEFVAGLLALPAGDVA